MVFYRYIYCGLHARVPSIIIIQSILYMSICDLSPPPPSPLPPPPPPLDPQPGFEIVEVDGVRVRGMTHNSAARQMAAAFRSERPTIELVVVPT